MINNVIYSFVNTSGVIERSCSLIILFMAAKEEYQQLLTGDYLQMDCQWTEQQDGQILWFKHEVIKWLMEAKLTNK